MDGLRFANGLVRTATEKASSSQRPPHVVSYVCRSPAMRRDKHVIAELPGFPDNLGADDDGIVWVAFASEPNPALESLHKLPLFLRRWRHACRKACSPNRRASLDLGYMSTVRACTTSNGRTGLCDGDRRLPRRSPHLVRRPAGTRSDALRLAS